jgi:hypothetical protein
MDSCNVEYIMHLYHWKCLSSDIISYQLKIGWDTSYLNDIELTVCLPII